MESFFVGISLSAVGGLAWLSYNHSKFAAKLLYTIFILTLLIHGIFFTYSTAWNESHISAKNSVTLAFAATDSSLDDKIDRQASRDSLEKYALLRKEIQRIKTGINSPFENAASHTQEFMADSYNIFYIIYAITLGLIVLSNVFSMYKTSNQQKSL